MASIPLKLPTSYNFRNPDEWQKWRKRFEQFRSASGLAQENEPRQVSTLLYCLGEEAEDVLASANITKDNRKKYESVLAKLDEFFKVRRNVIFERARFNQRSQREDESAEQYITSLYNLVENCEYGDLASDMIRDRLVVGIRDNALSQRLQMDSELTLEKAKRQIRQREVVQEQQTILHQGEPTGEQTVSYVKASKFRSHGKNTAGKRQHQQQKPSQPTTKNPAGKCRRCGNSAHPRNLCPAKEAVCHACKKKGHFSRQCLSKGVSEITEEESHDMAYLNTIGSDNETTWQTSLQINNEVIAFKLDTGAEVTALTEEAHQKLGIPLKPTSKVLCGPDRKPLKVLGMASVTLQAKGESCSQDIYVVSQLKQNLLGLPAIRALHLLTQVNTAEHQSLPADIHNQFPTIFSGLGTFKGDFEIHLKPDARPVALYTPRKIPFPLRKSVQNELRRMESLGVISKVEAPTEWCAGMVVVPKKDGTVRICVDLKPLNASVLRETHPLPKVDDILAQLAGARIFSKLDANSGFWQIPLAEKSRHLTTFITPFGRYCFNKMPFGISSAQEHFQRRMNDILNGLPGVVCLIDDVLVYGSNVEEHRTRLQSVLQRIQAAGVTLNKEKCEFGKTSIKFLGHLINSDGITADPQKTAAIREMERPKSVPELRRFLGMVNQLGKFSPNIAELTKPMRELLSKKSTWLWGPNQDDTFQKVKSELASPPVLAWYDPSRDTKISADASSYGIGAVLMQHIEGQWKPIAYASRSMTNTETRYAQIEKEALATTWAAEHFSDYITGRQVLIETDHKTLVPLLNTKHLDSLPPRVLRFRLRLMRFDYTVAHVPGTLLYTADTLSHTPQTSAAADEQQANNMEVKIAAITSQLPVSSDRLEMYKQAQAEDPVCSQVIKYCQTEWPERQQAKGELRHYWKVRTDLTYCDGLLLFGTRIVIPKKLQQETITKIHHGHPSRYSEVPTSSIYISMVARSCKTDG